MTQHFSTWTMAAVLLSSCLSVPDANARTRISVDGGDVTITVPIDAPNLDRDGAANWKKSAEDIWNAAFKGPDNPFASCFNLKLVADVTPRSMDYPAQPDRHMIFSADTPRDLPRGTVQSYPAGGDNTGRDSAAPYNRAADGNIDVSLNVPQSRIVAHEFGHLLGLADDYTVISTSPRRTQPLPGRQNTLMGDGGRIDSVLLQRLVDLLRKVSRDIPECWTGTWKVSYAKDHLGLARFNWEFFRVNEDFDAEFEFSVTRDGTVKGSGTAKLTYKALADSCQDVAGPPGRRECLNRCKSHLDVAPEFKTFLDVRGQRDESGASFTLTLKPARGEEVTGTMETTCSRAGSSTAPFDWFDCGTIRRRMCAASAHSLHIDSFPAQSGASRSFSADGGSLRRLVTIRKK